MGSSAPFRLTICGLDELEGFCAVGVSHVLSILDPGWPDPEPFGRYGEHMRLTLRFHDVIGPVPGMAPPAGAEVARILDFGAAARADGLAHLLVHCHAGVSRSTAAAAILLAQGAPRGHEAAAFDAVYAARPRSWPNSLLVRLADTMLGRDGGLVAAMQRHHARVARAFPDFAEQLRLGERAAEVPDRAAG